MPSARAAAAASLVLSGSAERPSVNTIATLKRIKDSKWKTKYENKRNEIGAFWKATILKVEISMIKIGELLRKLWASGSCFIILPPRALTPQGIEGAMKRDVSKHWRTLQWCASRGWVIAHDNWTSWHLASVSIKNAISFSVEQEWRETAKYHRLPRPVNIENPCGECPHPANGGDPPSPLRDDKKTNSPLKEFEWVKDGICIYSGDCVFTLVDKPVMMWNLDFQVKFGLEDQGQSTPKTNGS